MISEQAYEISKGVGPLVTGSKDKILALWKVAHGCQALLTIQLINIVATTIFSLIFDDEVASYIFQQDAIERWNIHELNFS